MPVDARRVIADLRELDRLTSGPDGAERVCWTDGWRRARDFLRGRLGAVPGVRVDEDEAGNLWAALAGEGADAVAFGSHIDSVPGGGWLDGALGVMAALELLRAAAADGARVRGAILVDFADEEGARFGRSLFGSSAVAGTLEPAALEALRDADGHPIREVLAEHGVELDRAPAAARRREGLAAYLELHIEQGPVLESEGVPVAAVTGTAGVERRRFEFAGQTSHAGTTPMPMRRDAGLAAARTVVAVDEVARSHGGVGTTGSVRLDPDIPTAVAGRAEVVVDLRHAERKALAQMLADVRDAARGAAEQSGCALAESEVWRIDPVSFDERLVAAALEEAGTGRSIASGALHDAAEMARRVPVAMIFAPSTGGISHAKEEDTPEPDLESAIAAFGRLGLRLLRGELV